MSTPQKHILVVDDEEDITSIIAELLEEEGYIVSTAISGTEAYELIKNNQYPLDMVLLDINMPDMNGKELMEKLTEENLISFPIVVMTAYGDKDLLVQILKLGCMEYIDKPFTPEQLLSVIQNTFKKQERLKKNERNVLNKNFALEKIIGKYKEHYLFLKREIDKAVEEYSHLVRIHPDNYKVKFAYKLEPYGALGGDFLGIHNTDDGIELMIADVAGHDMPASFHTVIIKSVFDDNVRAKHNGLTLMHIINRLFWSNTLPALKDRIVTAIFFSLNIEKRFADIVIAGAPSMMLFHKDSRVPVYEDKPGYPLGVVEDPDFAEIMIKIAPGDRIIFYTDGILSMRRKDYKTGKNIKITREEIGLVAAKYSDKDVSDMVDGIWNFVNEFGEYKKHDDMLLAAIEIP